MTDKKEKRSVWYRLLFTRDDDLDLLQIFFLLVIIYFMVAFALVGLGIWQVTSAAWTTFIAVFTTLAIAGTPKWIATLIANKDKSNSSFPLPDSPPPYSSNDEEEIG